MTPVVKHVTWPSFGLLSICLFLFPFFLGRWEEAIKRNLESLASPYSYRFSSRLALTLLLGAHLEPESWHLIDSSMCSSREAQFLTLRDFCLSGSDHCIRALHQSDTYSASLMHGTYRYWTKVALTLKFAEYQACLGGKWQGWWNVPSIWFSNFSPLCFIS